MMDCIVKRLSVDEISFHFPWTLGTIVVATRATTTKTAFVLLKAEEMLEGFATMLFNYTILPLLYCFNGGNDVRDRNSRIAIYPKLVL